MATKKPTKNRKPPKATKVAKATAPAATTNLSTLEARFCAEYVRNGGNGTQAYMAVRPDIAEKSARTLAARLLAKVCVKEEIATLAAAVTKEATLDAATVVRTAWDMMTADAREFSEVHVGCCRHCWGKGHRFQRTDGELADAEASHRAQRLLADRKQKKVLGEFDPQGGGGFDARREPNEDCPTCGGAGVPRAIFKDTRKLSRGAAQMFAGVKETEKGLEVKTHSKDSALDKMFRHFGLYKDKIELTMPTVLVKDMTGRKAA
jgi:phage terminase small subunit